MEAEYVLDPAVFGIDSTRKLYVTDHAASRWMQYSGQRDKKVAKGKIKKQLFKSEVFVPHRVAMAFSEARHGKKAKYFRTSLITMVMVDARIVTMYPTESTYLTGDIYDTEEKSSCR